MESAPKRSRSGDRRAIPRAPKPPPSGPAAEAKPGAASASAAAENPRAEPPAWRLRLPGDRSGAYALRQPDPGRRHGGQQGREPWQ
eukprot:13972756-Alexandrium_andersonii.AAC.1